jgi:hypothetical protein
MKNWLPIMAGLALLITTAQAGERIVFRCDDDEKDCRTYKNLQLDGDGVQVLYLGGDDDEPSFVPLTRFLSQRGYLGVSLSDLTAELREYFGVDADHGVLVSRVEEDSPADNAGVRVGDVITLVDGDDVSSSGDVARAVREKEEGDPIDIEVWRDGRPRTLNAIAAEREKTQFDLSGLSGSLAGLEHLGDMDWTTFMDADAINETVREAMENLENLPGTDGRYFFNFDPEAAEEFRQQWEMKFLDEDGEPIFLQDLEGIGERIGERMRLLEERLREMEEDLADDD